MLAGGKLYMQLKMLGMLWNQIYVETAFPFVADGHIQYIKAKKISCFQAHNIIQ